MKRLALLLILFTAVLAACRTADQPMPTNAPPAPTNTPTPAPAPAETAVPATATTAASDSLPAPTLFSAGWNDPQPYRPGLVPEAQDALDLLPDTNVYHLSLQIEEAISVITAQQEVRYTNQEEEALTAVYFHLFPNLLGGQITVSNVTVNGRSITPIFQSANDSVMQIPLAAPLPPGGQVVIGMEYITNAPLEAGRNYGIFAYLDGVLALAHFYPMVAVYDDEGWNIEPAAESGDVVYADASFFLVRATAPENQVIAASGVTTNQESQGDWQTITFAGGPMRDFYLAASADYAAVTAMEGNVTINSYAPEAMQDGAQAALDYATAALDSYAERFAPYPYTELDIVTTPTLALGIEYPGIIANTVRIYDLESSDFGLPNAIILESTTAHEVGHQWFYNLVGNDQLDEPWLDESLTQYATYLYYRDTQGSQAAESFYQSLRSRWSSVDFAEKPIGLPVEAYQGPEYSAIVYGRGPIFVDELAQAMGQDTFNTFIRDYFTEFRWENSTSVEFQNLAEEHCDCDLTPLFQEWIYTP